MTIKDHSNALLGEKFLKSKTKSDEPGTTKSKTNDSIIFIWSNNVSNYKLNILFIPVHSIQSNVIDQDKQH